MTQASSIRAAGRPDLLPILRLGDACRIFGFTPRALRFYDERGLVTAHRDRQNHRYYDGRARVRLGWIALLRTAGVSLPDIHQVLAEADGIDGPRQAALGLLERRAADLRSRLEEVEHLAALAAAPAGPQALARDAPPRPRGRPPHAAKSGVLTLAEIEAAPRRDPSPDTHAA